jgi:hypothetical protein
MEAAVIRGGDLLSISILILPLNLVITARGEYFDDKTGVADLARVFSMPLYHLIYTSTT